MEDRVGDVLAQRARLERGTGTAIALSLLLHGVMTGAAVWTAMRQPAVPATPGINIRFAPMPSAPRAKRSTSPRTTPAKPALPAPEPKAPPRIEAPRPDPPKTVTTTPEKNTVPLNTYGRSTRKGSETPAAPPPRAAAAPASSSSGPDVALGTQNAADVPLGGAGVTGLEGGDFPYTLYIERMRTLIGTRWLRPQVAAGTTTTVFFEIQRDGTIHEPQVKVRSGNSSFDRAALRAVMEASPLPPLPFGYNGTYLGVHLTFK